MGFPAMPVHPFEVDEVNLPLDRTRRGATAARGERISTCVDRLYRLRPMERRWASARQAINPSIGVLVRGPLAKVTGDSSGTEAGRVTVFV
jgi:hypothetical protein